jgi:hypothetical protein
MRIASLVPLLGLVLTQELPVDMTAKNAAEIVGGVLFGILDVPGSHLETCMADGNQLEQ